MRPMNVRLAVGLAALCVAAPLAAQAKRQPRAKPESAAKDTATRTDSARATTLSREVYAYEGGGRDPFLSLLDRKSTRLNSSHGYISYAVFCLKKKKNKRITTKHDPRRTP